jgi:beta-N-acetylhexosaminidase
MNAEAQTSSILAGMSLEEKVGQIFMLAFSGVRPADVGKMVREHYIGGCYISQDNAATPSAAALLSVDLQRQAAQTPSALPLLLGVDQEGSWGVLVPYSTTGPGNLGLGATQDPECTARMYEVFGKEMRAVGYNTILAPCADVNSNPDNPSIGMRSFGADPAKVARHVAAAVKGALSAGIVTTAKHFPGHGDTGIDSHRGLPRVAKSLEDIEKEDLLPFLSAIEAGVDIIMTSHILYPRIDPELPATLSPRILQQTLRRRMGFGGLILSDSMNMGAMKKNYPPEEAAVLAVLAGVDLIMLAEEHYDHDLSIYLENQQRTIQAVLEAVRRGRIPPGRIDEAVSRIIALKKNKGLLDADPQVFLDSKIVGCPVHRQIEARIASALVTLVRDRNRLWPLREGKRIAIVNAAPRRAYDVLSRTRGIGPNQTQPAFETFKKTISSGLLDLRFFAHEELSEETALNKILGDSEVILVVTEDYLIPGVDFDTDSQKRLVRSVSRTFGERTAVVGLRTPYELSEYQGISTYICTCSSRPCAAEAAAKAALGEIRCTGALPV